MPGKEIEKKGAKRAEAIVLLVFLAASAAALLSSNLGSNQAVFPVAGQAVVQYGSTPALPTTSTSSSVPEFGMNTTWLLIVVIALLWGVLVFNRRLPKAR